MNRDQAKELLPIIQAFAEGREIQFRPYGHQPDGTGLYSWSDMPDRSAVIQTFPADDYEYRIKPEPREFYITDHGQYFLTQEEYDSGKWNKNWGWIKVREVLDDS